MAAKIWTGLRSQAAHLRRLAVVFASELRLKIVAELYGREMSAQQFYREFGGESLGKVDYAFKKLAEYGWLRYVRTEGPGGRLRGAEEHFYRATDLAFIDMQTWAMLPYSIRVAFSWNACVRIAAHIREAIESPAAVDASRRRLSVMTLWLDEEGWERITREMAAQFACSFEEQEDARRRAAHTGEGLVRASSLMLGFESPTKRVDGSMARLAECPDEPLVPFPKRMSKVLADPVCIEIVAEANGRDLSAPQFHAEYGGDDIQAIRRRFKMLAEIGWLTKVDDKTGGERRGAHEYFYRASGPPMHDYDCGWANAPDSLKDTDEWSALERFRARIKEAMLAQTFDARLDRVVARSFLSLDRTGWGKLVAASNALRALAVAEGEAARRRLGASGEQGLAMTVVLGAFNSGSAGWS